MAATSHRVLQAVNGSINVLPATTKSLETRWRFPGEFLEILRPADGNAAGHHLAPSALPRPWRRAKRRRGFPRDFLENGSNPHRTAPDPEGLAKRSASMPLDAEAISCTIAVHRAFERRQ